MPGTIESIGRSPNIPFLNILDSGFHASSPEAIAAQELSWYATSPIGPLVLRYAQAQELLRDRRMDHNGRRAMELAGITGGPVYDWFVPMIGNQDGDAHRRLRGLMNRAFTPRMVNNLRPFIRATAERLTGSLDRDGACDFVEEFGNALPLAVMSHLLGVPVGDYPKFRTWTNDIGYVFSLAADPSLAERVENAVLGLNDYADFLIDRDARGSTEIIPALVAAHHDGRISRAELRNLLVTLVFAAHDTTRYQLANAMVAFAEHPDQWTLLGARPELSAQAAEEAMRWRPSGDCVARFAAEDFDYEGLHLAGQSQLWILVSLAQRDPRAFPDARTFDITVRKDAPPLQFGGGPHHCLGAPLARAELTEALEALTGRLAPPTLAGPVSWRGPVGIVGPQTLPLTFR